MGGFIPRNIAELIGALIGIGLAWGAIEIVVLIGDRL